MDNIEMLAMFDIVNKISQLQKYPDQILRKINNIYLLIDSERFFRADSGITQSLESFIKWIFGYSLFDRFYFYPCFNIIDLRDFVHEIEIE